MVAIMNRKKIFLNASYLFVGNVLSRFVSAIATIFVARYLGAEDYGLLGVALALAAITSYFSDLGLTHTLIREATKPNADIRVLISSFFRIRLILGGIITLLSLIFIRMLYVDEYFRFVLYWVVIPSIWGAVLQSVGIVFFQVIQQMQYMALIRVITGFITAGALFLGIFCKWPLTYLAPVYGLSSIFGGCIGFLMVIFRLGSLQGWNPLILKGMVSFTIGSFIIILLPQISPLLLERVTDLKQVGYFVAAYRIPSVLYLVPGTVASAFYPVLFEYGNRQLKEEHYKLVKLELKVMSTLGITMALPFFVYPEWWVQILFGSEWLEATPIFQLLSLIVILQSLNYPLADALTTRGWQKYRTLILTIALLMSGILYLFAGERWGAFGGAVAAIAVECILLLGFSMVFPKGWRALFTGTWRNIFVFIIVLLIMTSAESFHVHPIFIVIFSPLLFIFTIILVDRSLRINLFSQWKHIKRHIRI